MRLAFLVSGISYKDDYEHFSKHNFMISWKKSIQNYRENILSYFLERNYDIDTYLCTNDLKPKMQESLLKDFNPKDYRFLSDKMCLCNFPRNARIKTVIEMCLNSGIEYDLVILTRFDLFFKNKLQDNDIDPSVFNAVSTLENKEHMCDNFYIFPFKFLQNFLSIVDENLHKLKHFHFIMNDIKQFSDIRFICDENKHINTLSFYNFVRITPPNTKSRKFNKKQPVKNRIKTRR